MKFSETNFAQSSSTEAALQRIIRLSDRRSVIMSSDDPDVILKQINAIAHAAARNARAA